MITRDQLVEIGRFRQPHGIKGEVAAEIDAGVDLGALSCVITPIDGIFVPFFIKSIRPKGPSAMLLTIDDVNDETEVAMFKGKKIYALKDEMPHTDVEDSDAEEGFYAEDLIGYEVKDPEAGFEGLIEDIDDTTENVLFIVKSADGRTTLIPVADEYITEIDTENKIITIDMPQGILDL